MKKRLQKILIKPKTTIKQALKQIDGTAEKILFVVDAEDRLLGTVTDGDIRRWILKDGSLSKEINKAMNDKPIFLMKGYSMEEARKLMRSKKIECIPVVDKNKKVLSAIWWLDLFDEKFKKYKTIDIPVVVMAGGEGTRLSPFSKILPKPLIPVGEKPIIELILDKFAEYGCKEFYLSVNFKANIIRAYFNDLKHGYNINYIEEEKPLGTAGSLYLLKNKINKTFYVSNCDILIEADYTEILQFHKKNNNMITLITSMKHYIIPYGIIKINNNGVLKVIEEKPEYDFLVNTGMYVLEPEVLKDVPENKFYNITDLIDDCKNKGGKIGVYPISDKSWFDMGQWEEFQKMLKKISGD